MKMILLQDVKSVGKKGDLINASEGYAKNFQLPRNLAVQATKSKLNDYELNQNADGKRKLEEEVNAAWQAFADAGAEVLRYEDIDSEAFKKACSGVADEFIAKGDFTQEFYDALKG